MKNIFLVMVSFAIVLTLFVTPIGFVQQAEAGCICRFFPTYPTPGAGGVVQGYLEFINDGGRSCADVYGAGKKGVDLAAGEGLPADSIATNDPYFCDPNKGTLDVGWQIPTFSQLIGNVIRLIFFIAGLFALVFLLLGGFEWVQSGGEEKKIEAARGKITASVIGLVVMIAVLSLVIFLEQVVFGSKICLGISCPMNIGFLQLIR